MAYKLLLVDDDKENLKINSEILRAHGYQVTVVENGLDAIKAIKNAKRDFALVLMDYHMSGMNGAEAVAEIKKVKPEQQVVAFSLDDTREVMRETFRAGVIDFLDKNSENETLLATVAQYCSKYEQLYRKVDSNSLADDEKVRALHELGMIGRSESLSKLAREIQKVGPTSATTLVVGESGTGKELVAKGLHKASNRAKGPFVAINIAAEPASLLDSSLFGHKKGSFTGATHDQLGKFQLANKGTIFLDEIGDLSLDLQVKLLRVLQEREVHPVGSQRPISVDVRIVAATHKDLGKMVEEGRFREDLYYRLNSVVLSTTPLRDRREDVEPLIAYFTDEICRENQFTRHFQRRCLSVLEKYHWRGNVRELRSVVESHLVRSETGVVRVEDLDARLFEESPLSQPRTMEEIDAHLEDVKKGIVVETIKTAGSRAEASRRLGIAQNRLHYFITKWKLDRQA